MGLNDSYAHIRGQILLIEPLPSINKVFSLVVQEKRQRDVFIADSPSVENTALLTWSQPYNSRPPSGKDKLTCSHCGFAGHTIDKCYKVQGYPPGYKFRKLPYC